MTVSQGNREASGKPPCNSCSKISRDLKFQEDYRAFCKDLDKLPSSCAYAVYKETCKVARVPRWSHSQIPQTSAPTGNTERARRLLNTQQAALQKRDSKLRKPQTFIMAAGNYDCPLFTNLSPSVLGHLRPSK